MSGDRFEGNLTIKGERATTRMGKTARTASGRFVPVCSRRASKEIALATKERRWAITPPHFHNWPLWSPATGSPRSCFSAPFAQPCMLSSCLTPVTRATLCSHGPLPHIFYVFVQMSLAMRSCLHQHIHCQGLCICPTFP